MKRITLVLPIIIFSHLLIPISTTAQIYHAISPACREWMTACPLAGWPDTSFTDIIPVGAAIGEAQIVGAGESTHGTKEFYEQKIRLFKYLVMNKGFTTLMMEDGYAAMDAINRYIHTGEGDLLGELILQLYGFLQTEEIVELFEWMRTYNREHSPVLSCVGIDIQSYEAQISQLITFGRIYVPELLQCFIVMEAGIRRVASLKNNDSLIRDAVIADVNACIQMLKQQKNTLKNKVGKLALKTAYENCRSLLQWLVEDEYRWNNRSVRDFYMNINVQAYLDEQPTAKVFIWAHNGHVAYYKGDEESYQVGGALGYYLNRHYGGKYFSIGLLTSKGKYTAAMEQANYRFRTYSLPVAKKGSIEKLFSRGGNQFFIKLTDTSAKVCLPQGLTYRAAASYYHKEQFVKNVDPRLLYDGIIYMKRTGATKQFQPTRR